MAAWEEDNGTLVLMGSMQCPYYVHKAMLLLFPREPEKVRVIQTTTGGGFGGKEEYPNMLADHATLLSLKAKRPVKMIYDRHEDMRATTKRHPARVRHRTGVRGDGTIVAQDIDVLMDGGAYVTLSPTAQDVGKAINPLLVEGQIIGGTAQALGYALLENTVLDDRGVMQNAQFTNYIIPTTLDTPNMDVTIVEAPYSKGPFGAKGVGELPMDVPAPAVAAAIHDATGLFMTELPILPERLCKAFHDRAQS